MAGERRAVDRLVSTKSRGRAYPSADQTICIGERNISGKQRPGPARVVPRPLGYCSVSVVGWLILDWKCVPTIGRRPRDRSCRPSRVRGRDERPFHARRPAQCDGSARVTHHRGEHPANTSPAVWSRHVLGLRGTIRPDHRRLPTQGHLHDFRSGLRALRWPSRILLDASGPRPDSVSTSTARRVDRSRTTSRKGGALGAVRLDIELGPINSFGGQASGVLPTDESADALLHARRNRRHRDLRLNGNTLRVARSRPWNRGTRSVTCRVAAESRHLTPVVGALTRYFLLPARLRIGREDSAQPADRVDDANVLAISAPSRRYATVWPWDSGLPQLNDMGEPSGRRP